MPAEFLRGAAQPRAVRRRLGVLPLSIAAHAGAVIALVVIPLVAYDELPPLPRIVPAFIPVTTQVPRDVPVVRPAGGGTASRTAVLAPVQAAEGIGEERPTPAPSAGAFGPEIPGAVEGIPGVTGLPSAGNLPEPPQPPPPPPPQEPLRVGKGVSAPRKLVDVPPVYPAIASRARIEGVVVLEAVIDERGQVGRIRVLRSVALLDGAAIDAVKQWRYTPTLLNGVPVPVLMTITVQFFLQR
jgi:protein TonB